MSHFTPTDEQLTALEMAMAGNSFKVVAYAGAGKTSTLKLISEHKRGRGLYLAFNKAIATEAQAKFPPNVRCQTFHSLAFRHIHRDITAKISLPRLTPARLAEELRLQPFEALTVNKKPYYLSQSKLGAIISESLANFCKTSSAYPAPRHIVLPSFLANQEALQNQLYPALEHRWLQSIDPRHQAGISHDIYLKLWTLSNPIIPADFVLFDEAQDADPLMMGVLMQQDCQTIYVGDAHQQIYEWRGAVNAMKRLPYEQALLTQSFRFGQAIADVANIFLKTLQETIPLRGNPACQSSVSRELGISQKNAILCRTNASAMSLLLAGQKKGHKVALQADSPRILKFCQGAESLKSGKGSFGVPELSQFNKWDEVKEFADSHDGSEIKTWVNLVEDYGTKTLENALSQLATPNTADYIVSTAHKSKGLEWGRVQIYDDFMFDSNKLSIKISPEELRLLYVACTRGKDCLDVHYIQKLISDLQNKKVIFD